MENAADQIMVLQTDTFKHSLGHRLSSGNSWNKIEVNVRYRKSYCQLCYAFTAQSFLPSKQLALESELLAQNRSYQPKSERLPYIEAAVMLASIGSSNEVKYGQPISYIYNEPHIYCSLHSTTKQVGTSHKRSQDLSDLPDTKKHY